MGNLILSKGALSNVPYCDAHKDAVKLTIRQDKKMDLQWCSLRMMRIYMAVNRNKKSVGSSAGWNAQHP